MINNHRTRLLVLASLSLLTTLLAALPLTALARLAALHNRAPLTLFLVCGIFPLVPGAGIYYTACYFLRSDGANFAAQGAQTAQVALALALGIALVCALPLPHTFGKPAGGNFTGKT